MTNPVEELPFSLDWLTGAANKPADTLSVCDLGHLVVNGRTHWKPERVSADLHAIWFRWVEHQEAE